MFSKNKPDEPASGSSSDKSKPGTPPPSSPPSKSSDSGSSAPTTPKAKPVPSILSSDLNIKGTVTTSGDVQVEGMVEGDVEAHMLTIGENATVKGEVVADDVVVTGRVIGRVRGLKVRLTSTARVEGDIVHKTIAIESGAHFEGSVQRNDDPLKSGGKAVSGASGGSKSGSDSTG
ncbi:bactofilin family protein [Halovulum sp. GXIMD14793]